MHTPRPLIPGTSGSEPRPEVSPASFPIVAVGASAGGLAASGELLRELGAEPGIAVVIVHHLDPLHESGLVEIFSRLTALPVEAATEGARVERNHVYVMPPNAGLLISGGLLSLVPRREEAGLHLPINRFFEALAHDQEGLAVGVVLSGTGFDGTEGIKAIKREGGITLAQDSSAQYQGMPESAIATGCVDFVLPPAGLARELSRLAVHSPKLRSKAEAKDHDYRQILLAMRQASGVDFTSYKHSTIRRRLQRRLFFHGLSDLSAYVELLKQEPAEIGALCEEALIHVTSFFRDPEAFDLLRTQVYPKLCEGRARETPIRVWVPGCSTGEEVYSIAISLLEFLAEAQLDFPIKIFGTDLSPSTIEKARAGRYPSSIAAEMSGLRLEQFFSSEEGGYLIRRDVRERCVFAKHDVARDAPFSSMDLISCRNLMIYLGPDLQERVIALLHYALNEPGYLLLGSAESVRSFAGFTTVDSKSKLFSRSSAAPRLSFDFTKPRQPFEVTASDASGAADAGSRMRTSRQTDVFREADRLVLAEFAPAGLVVTDDLAIVQFRGRTAPFLEHAPGPASLELLRTAREELRVPLRRAIDEARAAKSRTRETGISIFGGESPGSVTLEVIPFSVHSARLFLVLFTEESSKQSQLQAEGRSLAQGVDRAPNTTLQQELTSTRQYLESVIEQLEATNEELKAANEEIVSSNEELRSGNEELESAKEELQATNEELRTLNDEMRDRSVESTRLSDDLTNVLSSAEIPLVIVGRDCRVRRFTPAAAKVFGLVAADLGRPLGDVRQSGALATALTPIVKQVLEELRPLDSTIQDPSGRWHQLWVRPYKTLDGRIDGTVIAARDIDAEKRSAESLAAARKYAEDVVEAIREGLVVLDGELRVTSANKAFLQAFRLDSAEILGRRLVDLGRPELAVPGLGNLLEALRSRGRVEDFHLERPEAAGRTRSFLLNARRIHGTGLYLLALQDVTELQSARSALERAELADILIGAAEGIFMTDAQAKISFANPAAGAIFGYESAELVGMSIDELVPSELREAHAKHRAAYWHAPTPRPMRPGSGLLGRRKDGTPVAIEVTLDTVFRDGGPVVVAFVRDVTKQRKVEHDIRAYQERLQRMSFEAVVTEERERRRIAIDLHDRLGQALALAQIKLTAVRGDLAGEQRSSVDGAVALLEQAISDARGLIFELSPPVLYDLGLKAALSWLAEDLEKRHGIKIEVTDDGADKPLDDAAKGVVFRAVRELLMNVLKHAQSAEAKVSLRLTDGQFRIDVEDGGVGFELGTPAEASSRQGFGLLSVREQIARLGGDLSVQSSPGRGTLASVRVPLQASALRQERPARAELVEERS
jgi:two-component system CheB/CheR fusion protein